MEKIGDIWVVETILKCWNLSSTYPTLNHSSGHLESIRIWNNSFFVNSWVFIFIFLVNYRHQSPMPVSLYKLFLNPIKVWRFERINQLILSFPISQERIQSIHRIEFWVVRRTCTLLETKRNPLKYWKCYIVDINHNIGVKRASL